MLKKLSFNSIKIGLGLLVCLNAFDSLSLQSQAATFRLLRGTTQSLNIEEITTLDFLDADLLALLIPAQEGVATAEDPFAPQQTLVQALSDPRGISLESIVGSLSQVNLDITRDDITVQEVPILPQVVASDIYRDVYDFGTTAASELSNPLSIAASPSPEAPPTPRGGVATTRSGAWGIPGLNLIQPALPRFGGPVAMIGGPAQNFVTPLRQVALPSANAVQAGHWGDTQVDVFFASLPQQKVVDVDTFMRTVYRTSVSDMVKQIDATLDLTIDTDFNSMPKEVFPGNPMPSGGFKQTL
ncbi:MAG: hypothetical protein AB4057_04395 [Crocosphaera sp.]